MGLYKSPPSKPDAKWFHRWVKPGSLSFKRGSMHKFTEDASHAASEILSVKKGNDGVQYISLQANFTLRIEKII